MSVVLVTGLPRDNLKLKKVIFQFKKIFRYTNIKKFWVRNFEQMPGSLLLKQCLVKFADPEKADKARIYLDKFSFHHMNTEYVLKAEIYEEGEQAFMDSNFLDDVTLDYGHEDIPQSREEQLPQKGSNDWGKVQRQLNDRGRERSRSPVNKRTDIDYQIDMLRKKRALVEEQKLLLVEEKKLELLKEIRFGNDSNINNKNYELFKKLLEEGEQSGTKNQQAALSKAQNNASANSVGIPRPLPRKPRLPNFSHPCRALIGEMLPIMNALTQNNETSKFLLTQLIRTSLKKRMIALLENQGHKTFHEIKTMYREKFPQDLDEAFVEENLEELLKNVPVVKSDTDNGQLSCDKNITGSAPDDLKETSEVKQDEKKSTMDMEHLTSASFDLPSNGGDEEVIITIS